MSRKFSRPIKRIVIKVGSSVIATFKMKPRIARLHSLIEQIVSVQKKGIEVVLVSSGAIVLGMGELNQQKRPSDLANLQALAAIGQTVLMKTYDNIFKKKGSKCAQVLLTWDDFDDRTRFNNARNTFNAIIEREIVPVVNENDTISTDEIKFGDNDKLSALVASLIHADLLIILSDVEGLYDFKDGKKELFKEVKEITDYIKEIACGGSSSILDKSKQCAKKNMSKGGMSAKLDAIKIATHAKIPCIIANGETQNVLFRILKGEQLGTFFNESKEKLISRKHWISFGAKPKGIIVIDDGAKQALFERQKSLLLPGIIGIEGDFNVEDVIVIRDKNGKDIGRGITNYSSSELKKIEDKKGKLEAVHRDNLVLS